MLAGGIQYILTLRNSVRRRITIAIDSVLLALSAYLSLSVVKSEMFFPDLQEMLAIATAVIVTVVTLILTKAYRAIIRHLDVQTIARIIISVVIASLAWVAIANYSGFGRPHQLTLLLVQCMLALLFLNGYRIGIFLAIGKRHLTGSNIRNVAVFGLGEESRQFAASLGRSKNYRACFFFADDQSLDGGLVDGLRVYSHDHLDWALKRFNPSVFVFPERRSDSRSHGELLDRLLAHGVELKLIDSVERSLGKNLVMEIARPLEIEDLLGRHANPVAENLLRDAIRGHRILVTGAAGSIGSAIARRIASLEPEALGLLDMDESGLVAVRLDIRQSGGEAAVYLGSIADKAFVEAAIRSGGYDTIVHAAAYKHVSMGEICPGAVITNNITGTCNLVEAAIENGVSRFLQISTDKSVEPTSVMGATKLWGEKLVAAHADASSGRRFASVRFGNVIESRGSVIPIFKEQIAKGGPVTVTHPDMQRYFMSIDEAVDLVIQAMAMADGGETFILDMGEPHRILDIAKAVIQLAGKTVRSADNPHGDVEIAFTGANEVEKLAEKLFADSEQPASSEHPSIRVSMAAPVSAATLANMREELALTSDADPLKMKETLFRQINVLTAGK